MYLFVDAVAWNKPISKSVALGTSLIVMQRLFMYYDMIMSAAVDLPVTC